MNKVLNRPLFRKEALRKGAIKPIHAQTGIMVGQPINNPNPQINRRTCTYNWSRQKKVRSF